MLNAHSQVLISLLLGDKLNSPHLEFGLEGGTNFSTISGLRDAKSSVGLNLGFYFDFMFKKNPAWMINTGVIVKSAMGADGLAVYSLNNETLDNVFAGGTVDREIRYFNVPVLIKYKFHNNIYIKGGTQLGLLAKAFDKFSNKVNNEHVLYKNNIRDKIHAIDAGLVLGLGYRVNGRNALNIGVQYYYGLIPICKGDIEPNLYNRSFYVTVGIPIGKGKAPKITAEKKAAEPNG